MGNVGAGLELDLAVDDALDDGQRREFELGSAVEQLSDGLCVDSRSDWESKKRTVVIQHLLANCSRRDVHDSREGGHERGVVDELKVGKNVLDLEG